MVLRRPPGHYDIAIICHFIFSLNPTIHVRLLLIEHASYMMTA